MTLALLDGFNVIIVTFYERSGGVSDNLKNWATASDWTTGMRIDTLRALTTGRRLASPMRQHVALCGRPYHV